MINGLILGVTLAQRLSLWYVILGMVLIVIGISLYILSRSIVNSMKKSDTAQSSEKTLTTLRIIAMVIFVIGIIIFILP